jgi:hypothetical protein
MAQTSANNELVASVMNLPDEDYLFIKDTGEARDLRTIQVKELQSLVKTLYRDYGYHRGQY